MLWPHDVQGGHQFAPNGLGKSFQSPVEYRWAMMEGDPPLPCEYLEVPLES